MGMKDYMFELFELEITYHDLIRRLLEEAGYRIRMESRHPGPGSQQTGVDFIAYPDPDVDQVERIIDAKLYTSPNGISEVLENACLSLMQEKSTNTPSKAVLIVSVPISTRLKTAVQSKHNLEIWDLMELVRLMDGNQKLKADFAAFVRDANIRWDDSDPGALFGLPPPDSEKPASGKRQGERLADDLIALKAGGGAAALRFEELCTSALIYLFSENFGNWQKQNRVEGGFHRLDLIARLEPQHKFWSWIERDFGTRFVVFEFKNYGEALSQDQIYTTEKYLFTTGLRSVAVIVGRSGFNESAQHAVKGALRESGKLMICLSMQKLLDMLRAKDRGDDPTNYLIEIVDNLLMGLGR